MKLLCAFISALILLPQVSSSGPKGWRGIVPLHSTRTDVEAVLGKGTGECECSYYRDDMNIFFRYSSGTCDSGRSGDWNIGPNTVIGFTIYPKPTPKLSDLKLDETKFEKKPNIGDSLLYVNNEEGLSMQVWQGTVQSFDFWPAAGDEYLRCPDFDGIHYSSSVPKELRARLLARLNQFVGYSIARQYEQQYELYLPEFALKMFTAKNKREFSERRSSGAFNEIVGAFNETLIGFKPSSVYETEDKTYGTVYEVFGLAKTSDGNKTVEGYRTTHVILKNKEWYFVDLFWLIPQ